MALLQVIIGLTFVLLLFSLLASTLLELISGYLSLRGANLRKALTAMLGKSFGEFTAHPFFKQLTDKVKAKSMPSYLKDSSFSAIVMDMIYENPGATLSEKIEAMPEGHLKKILVFLYRQTGDDIEVFAKKIEAWYNEVMDRASGWYKRTAQGILFVIGLGIAIVLNADVFAIYHNLSVNSALSEYVADLATDYIDKNPQLPTTANLPDSLKVSAARQQMDQLLNEEIGALKSPLGLGWSTVKWEAINPMWWLYKIAGWIVMAIAVSLGAPFWFDFLRKLINVRNAGPAPAQATPVSTPPGMPASPPPALTVPPSSGFEAFKKAQAPPSKPEKSKKNEKSDDL